MLRLKVEKKTAVRFAVDMKGDVQTYALNWLNICNNVRDQKCLLKCYNSPGSMVYVVCTTESAKYTKDWLEWFGDVSEPEEILCLEPYIDVPALSEEEYEKLLDAEFLEVSDDNW